MKLLPYVGILGLFCLSVAFSQLNLAGFQVNDARRLYGYNFMKMDIDTVDCSIEIKNGIALLKSKLTLNPKAYSYSSYKYYNTPQTPITLDSLETTLNFQLNSNIAATDLYLWVGNEKVKCYVQDRSLATAQYESIVSRRKDPALLSYNGLNNYSLQIFPLKTFSSRYVELEFTIGLNQVNDTLGIIPLVFQPSNQDSIKLINVKIRSTDTAPNEIKFINNQDSIISNLVISQAWKSISLTNVKSLKTPIIKSKVGQKSSGVWTGYRNGLSYFGLSKNVDPNSFIYKDVAENVFIVADISTDYLNFGKTWTMMAAKQFIKVNSSSNVFIVGKDARVKPLVQGETKISEQSKAQLLKDINSYTGNTYHELSKICADILTNYPQIQSGKVLLITDKYINNDPDSITTMYANKFLKRNLQVYSIGMGDNNLVKMCQMTRGFELGNITGNPSDFLKDEYSFEYGGFIRVPNLPLLIPNNNQSGLEIVSISTTGISVEKLSCLSDNNQLIHISGQNLTPGKLQYTVSGYNAGKYFTYTNSSDIPSAQNSFEQGSSLWAFQHSEFLVNKYNTLHYADMVKLGKDHHVVTRYTSFIALEPGMDLWTELPEGMIPNDNNGLIPTKIESKKIGSNTKLMQGLRIIVADMVTFSIDKSEVGSVNYIMIFDLKGRLIAKVAFKEMQGKLVAQWKPINSLKGKFIAKIPGSKIMISNSFFIGKV